MKDIRRDKKTSVNVPFTLISHDERTTVYNLSNKMFPRKLEKKVHGVCHAKLAKEYAKNLGTEILYECSKMSNYNTEYKRKLP